MRKHAFDSRRKEKILPMAMLGRGDSAKDLILLKPTDRGASPTFVKQPCSVVDPYIQAEIHDQNHNQLSTLAQADRKLDSRGARRMNNKASLASFGVKASHQVAAEELNLIDGNAQHVDNADLEQFGDLGHLGDDCDDGDGDGDGDGDEHEVYPDDLIRRQKPNLQEFQHDSNIAYRSWDSRDAQAPPDSQLPLGDEFSSLHALHT